MKLVYTCSPAYDVLKQQVFLPSLCEAWELMEIRLDSDPQEPRDSPASLSLLSQRWLRGAEILRSCPGQYVVFCDVDVQWFRPAQALLMEGFQGADVLFQRLQAGHGVSGGLLAVRSTPPTVALLETLADAGRRGHREGGCIDELIVQKKMLRPYSRLPSTFANDWLDLPGMGPLDWLVLYHSFPTKAEAGIGVVEMKHQQHRQMRQRVEEYRGRERKDSGNRASFPPFSGNAAPVVIVGDRPYRMPY
jgi:hypothetical protein